MGDVTLPAVGAVDSKWVWAGGAAVAGIVGYAWWTRGSRTDAAAGDQLAGDAAVDSGPGDGSPWPYRPGGSTVDSTPVDPSTLPPRDNAEWTTRATTALVDAGYEPLFVAKVLGKYFARQHLTSTEADLVRAAQAMIGMPPRDAPPIILTTPAPTPTPTPAPKPTPKRYITVARGFDFRRLVAYIRTHGGAHNFSYLTLYQLNPMFLASNVDPRTHKVTKTTKLRIA